MHLHDSSPSSTTTSSPSPASTSRTTPSPPRSSSTSPDELVQLSRVGARETGVQDERSHRTVPCAQCRRIRRVCRWVAGERSCDRCLKKGSECSGPQPRGKTRLDDFLGDLVSAVKIEELPNGEEDEQEQQQQQVVNIGPSSTSARWMRTHQGYALNYHLVETCLASSHGMGFGGIDIDDFEGLFEQYAGRTDELSPNHELMSLYCMVLGAQITDHTRKEIRQSLELGAPSSVVNAAADVWLPTEETRVATLPLAEPYKITYFNALVSSYDHLDYVLVFAPGAKVELAVEYVWRQLDSLAEQLDRDFNQIYRHPRFSTTPHYILEGRTGPFLCSILQYEAQHLAVLYSCHLLLEAAAAPAIAMDYSSTKISVELTRFAQKIGHLPEIPDLPIIHHLTVTQLALTLDLYRRTFLLTWSREHPTERDMYIAALKVGSANLPEAARLVQLLETADPRWAHPPDELVQLSRVGARETGLQDERSHRTVPRGKTRLDNFLEDLVSAVKVEELEDGDEGEQEQQQVVDIGPTSTSARWMRTHQGYALNHHLVEICLSRTAFLSFGHLNVDDFITRYEYHAGRIDEMSPNIELISLNFMVFGTQITGHSAILGPTSSYELEDAALIRQGPLDRLYETIAERSRRQPDLPPAEAVDRLAFVLMALDHLHLPDCGLLRHDLLGETLMYGLVRPILDEHFFQSILAFERVYDHLDYVLLYAPRDKVLKAVEYVWRRLDELGKYFDHSFNRIFHHPRYLTISSYIRTNRTAPHLCTFIQFEIQNLAVLWSCQLLLARGNAATGSIQEGWERVSRELCRIARRMRHLPDIPNFMLVHHFVVTQLSLTLDYFRRTCLPSWSERHPDEREILPAATCPKPLG
ncbi:hypothetical protein JCM8097_003870 [Rhodosporidiobolus ruineniae]